MNTIEARRRVLGRNVYKRTTEGNPAIATGSLARMYPGITMQGWTEQAQYEGKNLLNKNSSNWVVGKSFYWSAESGTPIEYSSAGVCAASILIEGIKPSTKYSFKNLDTSKLWVNRIIFADGLGNGYQNVPLYGNVESQNHEEYSINSENNENITHAYIQVRTLPNSNGEDVAITDQDIKDMLVCFSEGEPIYEPYTGGQPSPSPDYPQPITSAGKYNEETGKYEYGLELTGKNLFDIQKYLNQELYQYPDPPISGQESYWKYAEIHLQPNTSYVVSKVKNPGVNGGINKSISYVGVLSFNIDVNSVTITTGEDGILYIFFFYRSQDLSVISDIGIQIEYGSNQTDYQPYESQSVTLTSDRPLTKWDKLEKRNGQWGWVYKSAEIVLDGSEDENWRDYASSDGYLIAISTSVYNDFSVEGYAFSDKFLFVNTFLYEHPSIISPSKYYYFLNVKRYGETLSDWRTYLQVNPVTILYETAEETFVPLSESEQEAMNALYTFRPTTVLSNDCECNMALTYKTKKSMGGVISWIIGS